MLGLIIPIFDNTKVECINPKLLSEEEYSVVKEKTDKYLGMLNEFLEGGVYEEPSLFQKIVKEI